MKSYNHLWEKFISDENIQLAIKNASKGKKNRREVSAKISDPDFPDHIKEYASNFKNKKHMIHEIYDGVQRKKRQIMVPTFDEQVVHHMVVNVLVPIFMKGMYEHSYGSIPKRGPHKGKKAIVKWIKYNGNNCKYCLKMDIRKYFDSIPHRQLIDKFRKTIHDEKFLQVIIEIIEVVPIGLPIGFYTSQWIANWYLQDFDHYVKEKLKSKMYIRYMDDMNIFHRSKKVLHWFRIAISIFLSGLGLELKANWQVFKFHFNNKYRFLDFMGFRFYRDRVTLRRSIILKATRKARKIYYSNKITVYAARQMLSYLGWLTHADVYTYYSENIKPFVNFQILKRKLSKYDRNKRSKEYGMVCC